MSENKPVGGAFSMAIAALVLAAEALSAAAGGRHRPGSTPGTAEKAVVVPRHAKEIPLPEAELYLELNNTERTILRLTAIGWLRQ